MPGALMVIIPNTSPSAIAIVTAFGNWQNMEKKKNHIA